jgi:hypothetical protein
MERPEYCTDENLETLDELYEQYVRTGHENIYGLGRLLRQHYPELNRREVSQIAGYWMFLLNAGQRQFDEDEEREWCRPT